MIKSKKAIGVDDLFPLLFTVVVFVFIIMIFTYSYSKESEQINFAVSQTQGEIESYDLLNKFLSQKIFFDLNEGYSNLPAEIRVITMEEFIRYYYIEENPPNKESYKSKIQINMENMFNPLEYCSIATGGRKEKKAYLIHLTEDVTETYWDVNENEGRMFKSQSYRTGWDNIVIDYALPLPDLRILYIKFKIAGIRAEGDKSC
jgi:hypothetical protein